MGLPNPVRATWRISNGGWGGDLVAAPAGGLQLSYDTPDDARATIEYINRLLMTTARTFRNGKAVTIGDDPFHQDFGAGLRARVDDSTTARFVTSVQRHVQAGLNASPLIARNPSPFVAVQVIDSQTVKITLIFQTKQGVPVRMTDQDAFVFSTTPRLAA